MKLIQLIHNPTAGADNHSEEHLATLLGKHGYDCRYFSTKTTDWQTFNKHADILLTAGGDGTIRKVVEEVLKKKLMDKPYQMAILPLGTANNVSKALKIKGSIDTIIRSWDKGKTKSFDVGRVFKVADHKFFLESFGYGIFPYLIQEMDKLKEEFDSPAASLKKALEMLQGFIESYEPSPCTLEIDEKDYSGKYMLVEIMNTPSFGPNLLLSPQSNPGDGEFEVVLIGEKDKAKFAKYVAGKLAGVEKKFNFRIVKGKRINISCNNPHVHLDDQVVTLDKDAEVSIHVKKHLLHFLVP